VIDEGTVYTTNFDPSHDGSAIALDARDGSEEWRTTLGAEGDHGRALVDDRFIVAHGSELVALDRQDGEVVWRRQLTSTRSARNLDYSPELIAVDERSGTIVVPHRDGLEAFHADDGEPHWETVGISRPLHTPAIFDGRVYAIGRIDGTASLGAFDLEDGTDRWSTPIEEPSTTADPVVTNRGVLVVDGNTLCVHATATGDRRSEIPLFEFNETQSTTVAADSGTAFVATNQGLLAVDLEAETTRWLHSDAVYGQGFAVGSETVVAMVDGSEYTSAATSETITAFDRETGAVRWNYVLDGFHSLTIPPILVDGAVFFATSSMDSLAALGDVAADE
jgi:outer membrane protein assembly factor BamB